MAQFQIAPGLDGYRAAVTDAQRQQAQEVGVLMQLAQLQRQQQADAAAAEMRPLQMDALRAQIESRKAATEAAAGQRQAQGALSRLMTPEGSYSGPVAAGVPTAVAGNDADALRMVQEAEARGQPMGANVPNPQNVRALTSMAFPAEYGKAQAAALFPKPVAPTTPRQNIVPVTGGYLSPGADGAMVFTRTQEPGAGRAEPSPVVKDIIDPDNPNRLISIDVRKYRGGSLGSDGVIGIAGKEPTAQKKSEQLDVGRDLVNTTVTQLKGYYDLLNTGGGIVNQDRGALENIGARIAASGMGQTLGGAVGTKNQNARDAIEQQRPMLLRGIMQATGMSARQLDSNAELKLWLATATDPTKGYQANMDALNNIAEMFGKGGFLLKGETKPITGAAPQPAAGATAAPQTGIRFLGFENGPSR